MFGKTPKNSKRKRRIFYAHVKSEELNGIEFNFSKVKIQLVNKFHLYKYSTLCIRGHL